MNLGKLNSLSDGEEVCLSVSVEEIREYEGDRGVMGFVLLKDSYAEVDMVVFAKKYAECKEILLLDEPIWVTAQVDKKSDEEHSVSLIAKEISRVKPSNYSG